MIISCRQYTRRMTDVRDGNASAWTRAGVRLHHFVCGMCRAYTQGLDVTVATLHDLPHEPAPEDAKALVLRRLRDKRGG